MRRFKYQIYPPEDKVNPEGTNDLSPRSKFYQRALYADAVYPTNVARPLDTWYDKNLFGRVDANQNTIIPQVSELVEVDVAAVPSIYALGFVNRAFTDFASHMQTAYLTNCLNRDGNTAIINLKARIGYVDPTTKWEAHRDGLITAFINNYVNRAHQPIKTFLDFKPVFLEYLLIMSQQVPITKTNFLISKMSSPFGSGLKLGIAEEDAGNDKIKYQDFLSDPNYTFYANAAKKFGFIVDKNAPWILTADLFSNAALNYIDFYLTNNGESITPHNFFPTFFTQTYKDDFSDLRHMIRRAYHKFVTARPLYDEERTSFRPNCPEPLKLEVFYRQSLMDSDSIGDKELIDLYTELRYNQAQRSGPALQKIRERCYEIYRTTQSEAEILQFINATYKDFVYPKNYGNINLTLDATSQSDIVDTIGEIASAIYAPQTATY